MDYSDITSAIDFAGIAALILPAAGALVALYVLIKGCRVVIAFVRGGDGDGGSYSNPNARAMTRADFGSETEWREHEESEQIYRERGE